MPDVDDLPSAGPEAPEWLKRFGPSAAMIVAGIAITLIDGSYAASHGEAFRVGPLRLAWVAAVLVLGGIGLIVYRLLPTDE